MTPTTFRAFRSGGQWIAVVEAAKLPADVLPALRQEPGRLFRSTMGFGRTKAEAVAESRRLFEALLKPPAGTKALWHRSREGKAPRPVLVVERLAVKVRVLDLVDSTPDHLVMREVMPENLTAY